MIIGLISDTHITPKKGKLNTKISEIFDCADLILHAGDITTENVLDELSKIAPVIAVSGNNDKLDLNNFEINNAENRKILLTHGHKVRDLCEFGKKHSADIVISGHTHRPNFEIINNIRLINPGSASGADATVAVLKIEKEIDVGFFEI